MPQGIATKLEALFRSHAELKRSVKSLSASLKRATRELDRSHVRLTKLERMRLKVLSSGLVISDEDAGAIGEAVGRALDAQKPPRKRAR